MMTLTTVCVCLCVYVCDMRGHTCHCMCAWRSEDNFVLSVLLPLWNPASPLSVHASHQASRKTFLIFLFFFLNEEAVCIMFPEWMKFWTRHLGAGRREERGWLGSELAWSRWRERREREGEGKMVPRVLTRETVSDTPIWQHRNPQKSSELGRSICHHTFLPLPYNWERHHTYLGAPLFVPTVHMAPSSIPNTEKKKKRRGGGWGWEGRNSLVRTRINYNQSCPLPI